ncbi:glycosyltransferase family 2 protein [Aliarcobacter butzleri]|uniref:glycosyltransferase family 2 protein n=1 Tax=Aliarcobacter butzleri TaxID=28197 RepID=UPI003AFA86CB
MNVSGISVVIPLFNKEKFILRTINSVLNQTIHNFEIVIVDDGSTDKSASIVKSLKDQRIKLISQDNSGVSIARNNGVNQAKYEYIAFLDADDEWYSNHLEELNKLIQRFPEANLWISGYERSTEKKTSEDKYKIYKLKEYLTDRLNGIRIAWTSAVAVSKTKFLDKNGFMPNYNNGEDQALWLELVSRGYIIKGYKVTAKYNIYDDSLSSKLIFKEDACMLTVDRLIQANIDLTDETKNLLKEFKYNYALAHAINAFLKQNTNVLKFFLELSKDTQKFKKKRYILLVLYYLSLVSKKMALKIFDLISKKGNN